MGKKDGRCWVHAKCFNREVVLVQCCLRCGKAIEDEEDSEFVTCAKGNSGNIHKTCTVSKTNKRSYDDLVADVEVL
jgi:hypothetical protein